MNRDQQIGEIENKLGLALTISLFFPAFLIFLEVKDTSAAKWSAIAVIYLASYCLFELCKRRINDGFLRWINGLILLGVGLFIWPILLFSIFLNKTVAWLTYSSLIWSLSALPVVAVIVFLFIGIGSIRGNNFIKSQ